MAVIKAVSSKAGIGQALDYVTKDEKTEEKLISGINCQAETAKEEMVGQDRGQDIQALCTELCTGRKHHTGRSPQDSTGTCRKNTGMERA